MRASKNNTIEKFRVVRKALEEIDVSSSDRLLSNSIFLNVVKYFLNKDIRESFAVTKELKESKNNFDVVWAKSLIQRLERCSLLPKQ